MIHDVGNIELCELLDTEPKAQCKICLSYWDVSCETEQRRTRNSFNTQWISVLFLTTTQTKDDSTGTVTGRSQGTASTTAPTRSRRSAKSSSTWVSTTGSYETRSSAKTCLTLVALRKCVAIWTNWRTRTTLTAQVQKKFEITELTGGFVQTMLVPIRCQSGIDLTSSKHCHPCESAKMGAKLFLVLVELARILVAFFL